jgi:hypothetical protein
MFDSVIYVSWIQLMYIRLLRKPRDDMFRFDFTSYCRKKKLLAFPDLDSIQLFTCLWRNYPIFGYFKSSCHF